MVEVRQSNNVGLSASRRGVGISSKSVTSIRTYGQKWPKVVSQIKKPTKINRHSISRYIKISIIAVITLSLLGSQILNHVARGSNYVAPEARLANPIATPQAQPVDDVVAAEVAASAAQEADLLVTPNVANRADTLDAQVSMDTKVDATTTAVVDKPQLVAPTLKSIQNIQTITTAASDTVASLAQHYGISEDTIRWANNLKSDALAAGTKLTILPVTGVLYTVQGDDTADTLAATYQTSAEQIVAFNDVELHGLKPGMQIIIPNGVKPAAVAKRSTSSRGATTTSFAYGTTTAIFSGNKYAFGYCTYYAYNKRSAIGRPVGSNWGNATSWAALARASGFAVDKNPQAGDVFQTSGGWGGYGHVGFVESVNPDGSVNVSEMNYAGWNRVSTRTIGAGEIGAYNFIH